MGRFGREKKALEHGIPLHVLLTKDTGTDTVVAHCLEFDIVEHGASTEGALDALEEAIKAQLEYALAHDNLDNVFKLAPQELWTRALTAPLLHDRRVIVIEAPADDADDGLHEVKKFELAASGLCFV